MVINVKLLLQVQIEMQVLMKLQLQKKVIKIISYLKMSQQVIQLNQKISLLQ